MLLLAGWLQHAVRNEKNSNWEGGYRAPTAIRRPGVIKPGSVYKDVFSHEDMLPTLLAAAGERFVKRWLQAVRLECVALAHVTGF